MTRRWKRLAAVGAAAALVVSGCGGSNSGGGGTPNAAPTDKVLHLSFLQDPGQPPDPDIFYAGQGLLLTTNIYEGLLQYKAGTNKPELEPLLATEWTASPDNKVFTFKLRQGVKFHDGVLRSQTRRQPRTGVHGQGRRIREHPRGLRRHHHLEGIQFRLPGLLGMPIRAANAQPRGLEEERRHGQRPELFDHP
jgi:hypothetical protein